jgi:hypothetical protein
VYRRHRIEQYYGQAQSESLIESIEGGCGSFIGVVGMLEEKDWEDRQDEGSVLD